jgi:Transcriptional regulator
MKKKQTTKGKIISAAWKLFYKHGYDNTTVDQIIAASGTSKGSFYHYFSAKDALLSSLSYIFDERYEELVQEMDSDMNSYDKLMYLNQELFVTIEHSVSMELLASLYSSQIVTKGEKHLLDQNRYYYKLLTQIVTEGQKRGQIKTTMTVSEIVKLYALCERALLYDWCLCEGQYSLAEYSANTMPVFMKEIKQ